MSELGQAVWLNPMSMLMHAEWSLKLPELQTLSMANNFLTGSLPAWTDGMRSLVSLNLANNGLNGTVPAGTYKSVMANMNMLMYLKGVIFGHFTALMP